MSTDDTFRGANETDADDVVELLPDSDQGTSAPQSGPRVELVAGAAQSLGSEMTSLMQTRLRLFCTLLLIATIFGFFASLFGKEFISQGLVNEMRYLMGAQFLLAVGALIFLYSKVGYSKKTLKRTEYVIFGGWIIIWMIKRYVTLVFDAESNNITEMLVKDRESLVAIAVVIMCHGLLIPNKWIDTAKVVLSIAIAPFLVLAVAKEAHPELNEAFSHLATHEYFINLSLTSILIPFVAIYGSWSLNKLRAEAHKAKQFGQYQLLNLLGKGGMGEVYLAEHQLLKRPCALKLIRTEMTDDEVSIARFEREVKTTANLTHPNTIAIYDYGRSDNNTFYYVMEFLPGMNIEELVMEDGPLPAGRVVFLLRQVCSALADAHEAGLIHRDLKPVNLHVTERGGLCDFVKVLDFGLVKVTKDPAAAKITADQTVCGTPTYMSPEQAVGDLGLDSRCDIYSLGATAYFMLTGRPPFEGDNPISVMIAHASEKVIPPIEHIPDIPEDLNQVVMKCLAKEPDHRYQHMFELDEALANCACAYDWDSRDAALWWQSRMMESAELVEELSSESSEG